MRRWVWALVAVAACTALYFTVLGMRSEVPVRTAVLQRADIVSTESTNGHVQPTEDYQAHAPMTGVVKRVFVQLGQHVQAGQELIKMDAGEALKSLTGAQTSLLANRAALQNMEAGGSRDEMLSSRAEMDSTRLQMEQQSGAVQAMERLQAQGAASPAEVAAARQRLADTQVRMNQLQSRRTGRYSNEELATQRAQVAQAQAWVDSARSTYANVDMRAPLAGTVYALPVQENNFVRDGDSLVSVADLTRLQVRAYFDEPEVGKLATGQPVTIVWEAKPTHVWHGHIVKAPTTIIAYNTRNVGECMISVDDAKGDLLPNVNVTVKVTTSQKQDVLSLPREALHTDGANDFVYRIVGGRLVKTTVHVGSLNTTLIEVTSGLNAGDTIALRGSSETELRDGLRVKAQR